MSRAMWPIVGVLMLLTLTPAQPFGAMAQPQAQEDYFLQVHANASQEVRDVVGPMPDEVIAVNLVDADTGFDYGRCTLSYSKSPGGCVFFVTPSSTVIATLDASTLPTGVAVAENPLTYAVPAEKTELGDIFFQLVLADDVVVEPTVPVDAASADADAALAAWLDAAERMVDKHAP